ncbi:MAG TPA: hypothetical protein PKC39_15550 [Ferruginibacter sp.]|nr:hypothetical protein [Ferruginibacter sp.]HMP22374.1 hypothetical protein [Ferruginibacter sp.]
MKKFLLLLLFYCFSSYIASSQNSFPASGSVSIGSINADTSAILDIVSSAKGVLIPRTSTSSRNAINDPAKGLIVFDTTVGAFSYYNGTSWTYIAAGTSTAWGLTGNSITGGSHFIGTTNNTGLRFRTNNAERMLIDSTGFVGINTTVPGAFLHITKDNIGVSQTNANGIFLQNNTPATSTLQQYSPAIVLANSSWTTNGSGSAQSQILRIDNAPVQKTISTTYPKFRIQSSVNGASFADLFSVGGTQTGNTAIYLALQGVNILDVGGGFNDLIANSTNGMRMISSHYLQRAAMSNSGYWNFTPADLTGSLNTSSIKLNQTWNTTGSPTLISANVNNTASGTSANLFDIQVDSISRFRVNKHGRLILWGGIEQTNSEEKNLFSGNVGIATQTPNEKLHVSGNVIISDTLKLPMGAGYGKVLKSDAQGNASWEEIAIQSAIPTLQEVTTSGKNTSDTITLASIVSTNDIKVKNISIGRGNGNMHGNLVVGNNTLQNNTTGKYNIAFGDSALQLNTTGNQNTAIGAFALASLNTASNSNVAVGAGALYMLESTASLPNVAIGTSSMYSTTTGGGNTAMGNASLYANKGGANNVALGYWSMRYNLSGNENVAIGTTALRENRSGNRNTVIGREGLRNDTSGHNNVVIGYQSGYNNFNGSNNVFIGYQAGYNEVGSNKLYIANSATATPLIAGDFNTGRLGIGTTSNPTDKLEIAGSVKIHDTLKIPTGAGAGKILTSDSLGNATWQNITTGSTSESGWSVQGNSGTIAATDFIGTTDNAPLTFRTNNVEQMRIDAGGRIGIGTVNTNDTAFRLFVEKGIHTRRVKVDQEEWADFVFGEDYKLPSIAELETFIKKNHHLPGIQSEAEVKREGVDLGKNQAALLQKIEELTLYIIEQHQKIEALQKQNSQMNNLQYEVDELKKLLIKNNIQ